MPDEFLTLAALRCHVPGTKTAHRARHDVLIDAWALPFLEPLRAVLPNALLFPDLTRYGASAHHTHAAAAVQVSDYQLRTSVYHVATVYADFSDESAADTTDHTTGTDAASFPRLTREA